MNLKALFFKLVAAVLILLTWIFIFTRYTAPALPNLTFHHAPTLSALIWAYIWTILGFGGLVGVPLTIYFISKIPIETEPAVKPVRAPKKAKVEVKGKFKPSYKVFRDGFLRKRVYPIIKVLKPFRIDLTPLVESLDKIIVLYKDGEVYIIPVAEGYRAGKAEERIYLTVQPSANYEFLGEKIDLSCSAYPLQHQTLENTRLRDVSKQFQGDREYALIIEKATRMDVERQLQKEAAYVSQTQYVLTRPVMMRSPMRVGLYEIGEGGADVLRDLKWFPPIHEASDVNNIANSLIALSEEVEFSRESTFLTYRRGLSKFKGKYVKPDFRRHVGIFGSTGTGKTTLLVNIIQYLVKQILKKKEEIARESEEDVRYKAEMYAQHYGWSEEEMEKKIQGILELKKERAGKVLVLDWVGNLSFETPEGKTRIVIPGKDLYFNLIEALGKEGALEVISDALESVGGGEESWTLMKPMRLEELRSALEESTNLQDLMDTLENKKRAYAEAKIRDHETAVEAALNRLKQLNPIHYSPIEGAKSLDKYLQENDCVIINLAEMRDREGKRQAMRFDKVLFGITVLGYLTRIWNPTRGTLYLIVDEAQNYAYQTRVRREWILERLAREVRNYGVRLICATQNPSEISSSLMNNLIIKYILGLAHEKEINVVMGEFSSYKDRYPDHSPAEVQMIVKAKLQRMAKDERYVGCCFCNPKGMPIEVYVKYIELPGVKPRIEVTEEELKEREAREKEYLERKKREEYIKKLEELREKILENMARIDEVAKEKNASSRKVYKILETYLPTEFKERIKQYKGEEKFELGEFVIMRRGKLTNVARAYVRVWEEAGRKAGLETLSLKEMSEPEN